MSVTWSTLKADPDFIREGNEDMLKIDDYNDTALEGLMLLSAKIEMKSDLIKAWNLDESNTDDLAYLDNIVDKNEGKLKIALAYKQLYRYYFQNHGGIDTKTWLRMREYQRLYEMQANEFYKLKSDEISTTRVVFFKR